MASFSVTATKMRLSQSLSQPFPFGLQALASACQELFKRAVRQCFQKVERKKVQLYCCKANKMPTASIICVNGCVLTALKK